MSKRSFWITCGLIGLTLVLVGAWCVGNGSQVMGGEQASALQHDPCWKPAAAVKLPAVCGVRLTDPQISCFLPKDVEGGLQQPNQNVVQRAADIFSWHRK